MQADVLRMVKYMPQDCYLLTINLEDGIANKNLPRLERWPAIRNLHNLVAAFRLLHFYPNAALVIILHEEHNSERTAEPAS